MVKDVEILTKTPQKLPSREGRIKEIGESFSSATVEDLRKYYSFACGAKPRGLKKAELISGLASALAFADEKAFRVWFSSLPAFTRILVYRLTFQPYIPVASLEKEFGLNMGHIEGSYHWNKRWVLNQEYGLDILGTRMEYGHCFLLLPNLLRYPIEPWLVPPPELFVSACKDDGDAGPGWENSGIAESLPLFYDALVELSRRTVEPDIFIKSVRGFKKADAEFLRDSSGLKPFDLPPNTVHQSGKDALKSSDLVPDSADMMGRFILLMRNFKLQERPENGQSGVKTLVTTFFNPTSQYPSGYSNPPDRHSLEYNLMLDHLSKPSPLFIAYGEKLPFSRALFRDILLEIARDRGTFDAEKIADVIYRRLWNFVFWRYDHLEDKFKFKADTIEFSGLTFTRVNYDDFKPSGILMHCLLIAPLFKAYCYLFAALGVLEITQQMPALGRIQNNKHRPISPYDSLKTLKITELGRWCLGLRPNPPERPKTEYQAIADRELLLVTVQGNSLERSIYLDKIGRKLGEDRWRISPDSFISGCVNIKEIEERINKFEKLIDPDPAPHWLVLFERALDRAGLFDAALGDVLVYPLPEDRDTTEELLRDKEFRSIAHLAEGRLLIIPKENLKKFLSLLRNHGIAVFVDY